MKKTAIAFMCFILMIMSVNISLINAADTEYSVLDGKSVRLLGRGEVKEDKSRTFNWPNSGFEFEFSGALAEVYAEQSNLDDSEYDGNYFTVAVYEADKLIRTQRIKLTEGWNTIYTYNQGDPQTKKIMLVRSSEACRGTISISKVRTDSAPNATNPRAKRIEFIGDSYTAGYGNSPQLSDYERYCAQNTDNWNSYTGFVARHYNADSNVIAYMGKGVYANRSMTELTHTMSDQFNYEEIYTDTNLSLNMSTMAQYNPHDYQPQVVALWLGTNDIAAPVPTATFEQAYIKLLDNIRGKYPDSTIICMAIPKNNMYYNTIRNIVNDSSRGAKNKYYFHAVNSFGASGVDSHPNIAEDEAIATELIAKIDSIPGVWEENAEDDTALISLRADYNTGKVSVYGNIGAADENISALVLKSSVEIKDTNEENTEFIGQVKANEVGDYKFEFKAERICGEYTFYMNTKGMQSIKSKSFSFKNTIPAMLVQKDGETVRNMSQLKAGDILKVTLSGFKAENSFKGFLAIAQYKDGELKGIDVTDASEDSQLFGTEIIKETEIKPDIDKVKIMYLNESTLAPLIAAYSID